MKWKNNQEFIEMLEKGIPYQDIADKLGVSKTNVSVQASKIYKARPELKKNPPWTEEEDLLLVELRDRGVPPRDCVNYLPRSYDAIKKRYVTLGLTDGPNKGSIVPIDKNKALEIVRKYITAEACSHEERYLVRKSFGSWTEALYAAGISPNIPMFDYNKKTKLYFLDFGSFQKIGVTQRELPQRFSGAPPYTVLDILEGDCANILELEALIKKNITPVEVPEWFERNGKTECFVTSAKTLEELL